MLRLGPLRKVIGRLGWEKINLTRALKHVVAMLMDGILRVATEAVHSTAKFNNVSKIILPGLDWIGCSKMTNMFWYCM